MRYASQYSYGFHSDLLDAKKFDELLRIGELARSVRNEISSVVYSEVLYFLDLGKFEFIKEFERRFSGVLPSAILKYQIEDVFDAYKQKFLQIKSKLKFESVERIEINVYKKSTKAHRKGDFKSVERILKKDSIIARTLTYLARFGNDQTECNIRKKSISEADASSKSFCLEMTKMFDKFGFDRLYRLAVSKRERIMRRYNKVPIEFKSLNFTGNNRISQPIVAWNKRFGSRIGCFVTLGNVGSYKKMHIPVKYAKKYHGGISRFQKGINTSYTVCFGEDRNQVRIVLSIEGYRENNCDLSAKVAGIDVNSKHNLLVSSEGHIVDYDHKLLERLSKEHLKTDELKKADSNYKVGRKREILIKRLERKLEGNLDWCCSKMCRHLKENGFSHIVLENLGGFNQKSFAKDENDLNYNRRVRLLKLSSIKDRIEHICVKHGQFVSLVHSQYTSKTCPVCGCISDQNRKTQEDFKCVECGHSDNADHNASINILLRVTSTVLRNSLLKQNIDSNICFVPQNIGKQKIKEILESHGNGEMPENLIQYIKTE